MNKEILKEIEKISGQRTAPLTILMAVRSRIEKKANAPNPIGRSFKNGNKSVLIVGKSGCGKTSLMKKIYNGLNLDRKNSAGKRVGHWISSVGASTGVGIYEILQTFNENVIFADELSLDTPKHLHIIKQIANGEIVKPRSGDIESIPFKGLLVSATNAVKVPKGVGAVEHLLAVLDRFFIVKMDKPPVDFNDIMEEALNNGDEEKKVDFGKIKDVLTKNITNGAELNEKEKEWASEIGNNKALEILDTSRPIYRMCHGIIDILLFVKRFFDVDDLTEDKEAKELAEEMIKDGIIANPVEVLWLDPIEEVIYKTAQSSTEVSLKDIMDETEKQGIHVSRQYLHRVINKMIEGHILRRSSRGKYSCRRKAPNVVKNNEGVGSAEPINNELLDSL